MFKKILWHLALFGGLLGGVSSQAEVIKESELSPGTRQKLQNLLEGAAPLSINEAKHGTLCVPAMNLASKATLLQRLKTLQGTVVSEFDQRYVGALLASGEDFSMYESLFRLKGLGGRIRLYSAELPSCQAPQQNVLDGKAVSTAPAKKN